MLALFLSFFQPRVATEALPGLFAAVLFGVTLR